MNRKWKKTAGRKAAPRGQSPESPLVTPETSRRKAAGEKRAKAEKKTKSEPITSPEENRAENPVNLFNELARIRQEQKDELLKQETISMGVARGIIRAMFDRMNQLAPSICQAMLNDIVKAEIVQHGPQWDESIALSKMTWHLQLDDKYIEMEIDNWLKHRPREEYGPASKFNRIVYTHYKYLRLGKGFLFGIPKRERPAFWKELWRQANQDPLIKDELKKERLKSPQDEKDKKKDARDLARYSWRRDPEIQFLKRTVRR